MEWIQRNPKTTIGLSALAVLVVVILVWGMTGGSGDKSALGTPLATPTATPTHRLTVLPTPSATPSSVSGLMQALSASDGSQFGTFGDGSTQSLTRHRVTVSAGSDGPMMAIGWWIPLADGPRKGSDTSKSRSFHHSDVTWGDGDLARVLAFGGPYSLKTWCTVTVDGRVTERQEAKGPWARVFCQG